MNDITFIAISIYFSFFMALAVFFAIASKGKKRKKAKKFSALLCLSVAMFSLCLGSYVVFGTSDASVETRLSTEEVETHYLNGDITMEEYKAVQNGSAVAYNCASENCWFTSQQRVKVVYNQSSNRS